VSVEEIVKDNLDQDSPLYRHMLAGEDAQKRHDLDAALKSFRTALRMDPECAYALHSLSVILAERKQNMAAVACARRALAIVSDAHGAYSYLLANLGSVLTRMEHYGASVQVFERLVERHPDEFKHWHHLALALTPTDVDRAIECLDRAMEIAPTERRLWRDSGLLKLTQRRWLEGFGDWHRAIAYDIDDLACGHLPQWRGEPLNGKTIVVYHEQGFGDTVQFLRFLPMLRKEGARVVLAVPAPLIRLVEASSLVDEVLHFGEPPPPADYQCPLMGVFAYRDISPLINEPLTGSYLKVLPRGPRVHRGDRTVLMIGVCWAGNPRYGTDHLRSMPFENFLSIADIPGVQLVSLQKWDAAKEIGKAGADSLVADYGELVNDMADIAHVISQLDLVVSVDTAALHVAGALDVPAIGLLPYNSCWRWGRDTNESVFYPSVELVRQEAPGDWVGVMIRVRKIIAEILERDVESAERLLISG
jgi:hypothetical protein